MSADGLNFCILNHFSEFTIIIMENYLKNTTQRCGSPTQLGWASFHGESALWDRRPNTG
jgi:hypothetical protein